MNIILIGFKNSGKTSIGKWIAHETQRNFVDTDQLIENYYSINQNQSLTTCEIYQHKGKNYFRELEKNIISSMNIINSVVATGGGSILNSDNVIHLKKLGKLVYLKTSYETLLQRLLATPTLPAFLDANQPEESFLEIYNARKLIYASSADNEISTENKSIQDISVEIINLIGNFNGQ